MTPITITGFLICMILGAIILYVGIHIGRQMERYHIIVQVSRRRAQAEAAQREQVL
ncbi:MAG: hypothetical protein PVS3B3_13720 [Ktedonobacteraceae bacterium]